MKKLRFALLSLMLCSSGAFAYTQTTTLGPFGVSQSGSAIDIPLSFTGVGPALVSDPVTLTITATGDADGNFSTEDPFRIFAETLSGTPVGTVGLDNVTPFTVANTTSVITIPAAVFNTFVGDGVVTFHFTNPAGGDSAWMWLEKGTLEYTPVPVPAALPLFLSGLLVLARGFFRRKSEDAAAAV